MNKVKLVKKKKERYVNIKLLPIQSLNQREIELLGGRQVSELIPPQITIKKKPELMYRVTEYVTLREYLKSVTPKTVFLNIVLSIMEMLKKANQLMLYQSNFILDIDMIYIHPLTKQLMYVYVPAINFNAEYNIKEFLASLTYGTVFNHLEDCSYVTEYISYFKTHPDFSIYDFEMFIREMNGETVSPGDNVLIAHPSKLLSKDDKICLKCDKIFKSRDLFCDKCGERLSFNKTNPVQSETPSTLYKLQAQPQISETQAPAGTTVLGVVEYGTTVLSPQELGRTIIYPSILRKNTGEKIVVNSSNFSVGQGDTANYIITGNTAISRNHARIITRDNAYYVIDNSSTNGTYIDDVKLSPDVETEIVTGQKLRFANEEYEFMV